MTPKLQLKEFSRDDEFLFGYGMVRRIVNSLSVCIELEISNLNRELNKSLADIALMANREAGSPGAESIKHNVLAFGGSYKKSADAESAFAENAIEAVAMLCDVWGSGKKGLSNLCQHVCEALHEWYQDVYHSENSMQAFVRSLKGLPANEIVKQTHVFHEKMAKGAKKHPYYIREQQRQQDDIDYINETKLFEAAARFNRFIDMHRNDALVDDFGA